MQRLYFSFSILFLALLVDCAPRAAIKSIGDYRMATEAPTVSEPAVTWITS